MKTIPVIFFFLLLFSLNISGQEICNNGIDDDGDGLIDLNDTADCFCNGIGGSGGTPITSIIPNPSFEQMNCCPSSWSQMNCATGWIQASGATSDYINTCNFAPVVLSLSGLIPFPNGNGIVGGFYLQDWREYVGACLTQPMLAGQSYTIQMNIAAVMSTGTFGQCNGGVITFGPVDVTIYGSTNCGNQPFVGFGCPPLPAWQVLASANYTPVSSWGILTITFTPPVNITVITIGPPCLLPPSYPFNGTNCYPYFLYDNLILNTTSSFSNLSINQTGTNCQQNIILNTHADTNGGTWQWYQNGISIAGQTDSIFNLSANNYGAGVFTAMYSVGGDCQLISDTNSSIPPSVNITSHTNASCNGISDGNASSLATGGIGGLNYSWNTAPVQSSPIAINLSAGTYTITVTDSMGCIVSDSVTITDNPTYNINNPQSICTGQNYLINSHSYSVSGTYFDTLATMTGCDSIISTLLNVNNIFNINNPQTICNGQTYSLNAHFYSSTGTYYDTIPSATGCDSVITTQLTVNPNYNVINPQTLCSGQTYSVNSHVYSATGIYYDTLSAVLGCDSVIITQLTQNPAYSINNPQTICTGQVYSINSHNYSVSGTYFDTISSSLGCDSVIITQLISNTDFQINNPQTICTGQSYSLNTHTYSAGGIYYDTLSSITGCDSIIVTQLSENATYSVNNQQLICAGDSYSINSHSYTASGTYFDTLSSFAGCDSVIITQLISNPVFSVNNPRTICSGESYSINSHIYSASGTYFDTIPSVTGCDSVIVSDVTVNPLPVLSFTHPNDVCIDAPEFSLNYAVPIGGNYSGAGVSNNKFNPQIASAGIHLLSYSYSDPITNCANSVNENITVHPLPIVEFALDPKSAFLQDAAISFVDLSHGAVRWLWDFGDGSGSGNKHGIHTYNDTGYFHVTLVITDNFGCENGSLDLIYIGPDFSFFVPNSFTPNGDGINDSFNGAGVGISEYDMFIYNRWGNSIFHTNDINKSWSGNNMPEGTYVYKISLKDVLNFPHEYVGRVSIVR